MDQHSSQRYAGNVFADLNLVPLFQPAHSCQFNSIEHLWGWLKREVAKALLQQEVESEEGFRDLVRAVCLKVNVALMRRFERGNRQFLVRQLQSTTV
jgi:transposase